MSDSTIRVYVDSNPLDVPHGATVVDAVRCADPTAAEAVLAGTRGVTDSRGLPVAPETPLFGGAILRLVAARTRSPR